MDTTPTLTINRDGQQYGPTPLNRRMAICRREACCRPIWRGTRKSQPGFCWCKSPASFSPRRPRPPPAALTPAKERNVFLLIVMGFVWFVVLFFVPYFLLCVLAGAVAGGLHPDDAADAGREAGKTIGAIILFPIFFVSIGLSIWLTIIGKLPGTRK